MEPAGVVKVDHLLTSMLAGRQGLAVPMWVFFAFVGLLGLYIVVNVVRVRRKRRRAGSAETTDFAGLVTVVGQRKESQ